MNWGFLCGSPSANDPGVWVHTEGPCFLQTAPMRASEPRQGEASQTQRHPEGPLGACCIGDYLGLLVCPGAPLEWVSGNVG